MGIPPSGFLAVTDAVRRRVPVLARYAGGNDRRMGDRDAPPSAEHSPIAGAPVLHQNYLEPGLVPEACQRGLVTQAAAWFEIPSWWTKRSD